MKTVTGRVVSSKPISLSKAASTLSSFLSTDNGASQALCAYLRRASASFNELKQLHKELKSSRSDRNHRHHGSEAFSHLEAAVDNPYRSEASHEVGNRIEDSKKKKASVYESKSRKNRRESRDRTEGKPTLSVQSEDERVPREDGKTTMASSEVEDKPSRRVAMEEEKSGDKDNDDGKDLVELLTKKKKKKREEDADVQKNISGAIEKEEMSILDSKELKRKERKKRKNRVLEEEGGGDGSEEQQGMKRRKKNL